MHKGLYIYYFPRKARSYKKILKFNLMLKIILYSMFTAFEVK